MRLADHPFPVEAFFDESVVLTYAVAAEGVRKMVPPCLELDLLNQDTAFVAVAMVSTRRLRPAGYPRWLGQDFFLAGYRVFVRYKTRSGRTLRGLYILKSVTDRRRMVWLGNLFTHYRYSLADLTVERDWPHWRVVSQSEGLKVRVKAPAADEEVSLPLGSPFHDWHQARLYAGPMPFTFSVDEKESAVVIVEGRRETWKPQPLWVEHAEVGFLKSMGFQSVWLASAFVVRDVPYRWEAGQREKWL
jgi:uncharacterized protein YqjF (DUF2071 family)